MEKGRFIDLIVIHCSDTYARMDIGTEEIREWHVNENKWKDIGYHYVIRRKGKIEEGRPLEIAGSHAYGYNKNSIGICLVGGKPEEENEALDEHLFTEQQFESLKTLLKKLLNGTFGVSGNCKIVGHRELNSSKTCPNFDVQKWLKKEKII